MIPLDVKCRLCNANLMDAGRPIDGHASVHLRFVHDGRAGDVWLSALYGSPVVESSRPVPSGAVVELLCPVCERAFRSERRCTTCYAPMVNLGIQVAGEVVVCCRWGCKSHLLEFSDVAGSFRDFYEAYSPFFAEAPSRDPESDPKDI